MARLRPLPIRGAFLIEGDRSRDARGAFTRVLDLAQLAAATGRTTSGYLATAENLHSGTVRGIHYQAAPDEEAKTVWCSAGAAFDVLVDLRPHEPTYRTWLAVDLSADSGHCVHIPRGVGHGYQTTLDNTVLNYLIDGDHQPASARVIRWNDSSLGITWPLPVSQISTRDQEAGAWPGT